jgi:hypothetical protein
VIRDTVNALQVTYKMIPAYESPAAVIDVTALILADLVFGFHVTKKIRTQAKGLNLAVADGTTVFALVHSTEVFPIQVSGGRHGDWRNSLIGSFVK